MERKLETDTRSRRLQKKFGFLLGIVVGTITLWAFLFDPYNIGLNPGDRSIRSDNQRFESVGTVIDGATKSLATSLASDIEAGPDDMCATNHCSQTQTMEVTKAEADYVTRESIVMQTDETWKATESKRIKLVSQSQPLFKTIRKYSSLSSDFTSNFFQKSKSNDIGYQSNERVLNIHVVPHSHDDTGWRKTVDQYYYGWNNTIQKVSVREILTTVVEALEENPSRTFTFAEIKFLAMWWEEQPESVRERVQKLVKDTKQLTFVNGGWCMHDEAATHYIGMIDQTALGHEFLKRHFDYIPTVGWQLDPFGHSSTQASLMTYKMGFNSLYFGRIDYQDLELRHATKECEGLWNTFGHGDNINNVESEDTGNGQSPIDEGSVFWGLTGSYEGNYGSVGGYCFDINCGPGRKSLIDKNRTTLLTEIQDILFAVRQQSDRTKGNHVMLTMGSDYQYQRASINFANLDLLIGTVMHLQEDQKEIIPEIFGPEYDLVNIFYSSPEYYTECKYNETLLHSTRTSTDENHHLRTKIDKEPNTDIKIGRQLTDVLGSKKITKKSSSPPVEWTIKKDDFFPYSDCPNCLWTGYFTSRPSLKRFERVASSLLLAGRQIDSISYQGSSRKESSTGRGGATKPKADKFCESPMYLLEDAVGVVQHHDAVSGTSKQHVAYDYTKSIQEGIDALVPCMIRKLKNVFLGDKNDGSKQYLRDLTYCQLLNETKCGISVDKTAAKNSDTGSNKKDLYVVVYNSLASNRSSVIDLPIGAMGNYLVEDMDQGSSETITALPAPFRSSSKYKADGESFVLSFMASSLPAVGAKIFRIQKQDGTIDPILNDKPMEDGSIKISNGHFSVVVDTKTGSIRRIGTQEVGELSSWGYYTSFDSTKDAIHNDDNHNSGAYIFRPSTPNQELQIVRSKNSTIIKSSIGTDIHTEYQEPWIQTTTRIRNGIPYVEIEYQIGPVPISDGRGKEVVARYNSGVKNEAIFYTDSNGREFIKRQRNHRPTWDLTVFEPVAGNYYPINAAIYIDEHRGASNDTKWQNPAPAFAVVTDRTQGGGSILDETVEVMVHRRTVMDDFRGVDEPLNETDVGITPCPPYGNASRIGEGLVIRGKHRILVEKTECGNKSNCESVGGARLARSVMDAAFAEPLVFVASAPSSGEIPFYTNKFSGLVEPLPNNVMLITKRRLSDEEGKSYLIRLGHQYGDSVDVDLSILFPNESILEVDEMTLSGNWNIDDWRNERFDWIPSASRRTTKDTSSFSSKKENDHKITLTKMDIRTFIVKLKSI